MALTEPRVLQVAKQRLFEGNYELTSNDLDFALSRDFIKEVLKRSGEIEFSTFDISSEEVNFYVVGIYGSFTLYTFEDDENDWELIYNGWDANDKLDIKLIEDLIVDYNELRNYQINQDLDCVEGQEIDEKIEKIISDKIIGNNYHSWTIESLEIIMDILEQKFQKTL